MLRAKKVTVRRFGGDNLEGYVDPQEYLNGTGVEVHTKDARTVVVPYGQIRAVYFVRKFGKDPEAGQRVEFDSRPKQNGLWVRLLFSDGGYLEGVMPNDLLLMDRRGVTITPPDANQHSRSVFVPQTALEHVVVRGLIGRSPYGPVRRSKTRKRPPKQPSLFPSD